MGILDRIRSILAAELGSRTAPPSWTDTDATFGELDGDTELRAAIDQAVHNAKQTLRDEVDVACNLLGVSRNLTMPELRTAYRAAIRKWHPDLYVNASADQQRLAADQTKKIVAAYLLLSHYIVSGRADK